MTPPADTLDDDVVDREMLQCLATAREGTTICPSLVARHLERDEARWRARMPQVRERARALARHGLLEVTQRGRVLSCDETWRGAIRLRARKLPA